VEICILKLFLLKSTCNIMSEVHEREEVIKCNLYESRDRCYTLHFTEHLNVYMVPLQLASR
jgi:hypothetical protein